MNSKNGEKKERYIILKKGVDVVMINLKIFQSELSNANLTDLMEDHTIIGFSSFKS